METTFKAHATVRNLPVIPLRGNVAFPHTHYRIDALSGSAAFAFAEALNAGEDVLLLTQKDIMQDTLDTDGFFMVGTVAKTKKVVQNSDMTRTVVFECLNRAAVLQVSENENVFRALIAEMGEPDVSVDAVPDAKQKISVLRELLAKMEPFAKEPAHTAYLAASSIEDVGAMSDFVASSVLTDYTVKQLVLDEIDPVQRVSYINDALRNELERLQCEASVQATVQENIEENHREYYLREQLKAIQNELGGDEDEEIREYSELIEKANLSKEVKDKLQKELSRLAKTPYGAAESTVLRNYLDTCLDIPWNAYAEESSTVAEAAEILNADHDGLDKVKERILEYIAVRQISDKVKSQILCLVGPPGVGKTSIALSIARALKRPYARISLGGIRDEADIRGHRKTYVGAMPGRIVEALTHAKVMNPVIILDEIDKLTSNQMGDPASALLEVLDPEQNKNFRDHFTELPMNLSECIFIATANYYGGIPAPLLDRMEILELNSYTDSEKLDIASHHLIPKQLESHGLTPKQLRFTHDGILEIIRHYTKESGVRQLEREIAAICRKVAKKIAENTAKTACVTPKTLKQYLGARKFFEDAPEAHPPVGVVNGLAYTSAGGDLLKVEVLVMEGTGKVELTGSLGDVMKESARIAISFVRSVSDRLGIAPDFYLKKDIHIHFPEGAIPKDGPSAGITMTCAIVSALTGLPARPDVAMTGEMTLRGKIMPIGGLKEKAMAAYRAGIRQVLIPRLNATDLEEIDAEAKKHLEFILCDSAEDALRHTVITGGAPLLTHHATHTVSGQLTPHPASAKRKK